MRNPRPKMAALAAIATVIVAAACGGGPAPSAATPPPPSAPQTTAPAPPPSDPATTEPPASPAGPDWTHGIVACNSNDDTIGLYDPATGAQLDTRQLRMQQTQPETVFPWDHCTTHEIYFGSPYMHSFVDPTWRIVPAQSKASSDGTTHVGTVDLLTGEFTDLSGTEPSTAFTAHTVNDTSPALDKTGTHLWFVRDGKRLMMVDVKGGAPKDEGATPCDDGCEELAVIDSAKSVVPFEPITGNSFAQRSNPDGTMTIDVSSTYVQNPSPPPGCSGNECFETKVAFLTIQHQDGSSAQKVALPKGSPLSSTCTWADNTRLVCVSDIGSGVEDGTSRLAVIDVKDPGKTVYITPKTESTIENVAVSPDHKTVLFRADRNQQSTLFSVPLSGGTPTEIGPNGGMGRILAWS